MRIGFDVRPFLKGETGVGIYFKNLLFSLSRVDKDNHYYLFSSSWKDRFSRKKIPPLAHLHFHDFRFPVRLINFFWYRTGWPPLDFFFRTDLDLVHSPTPLILPTRGKKIVTVYDLFFLDFPHLSDAEARRDFSPKLEESLRRADGIVTISQFTREQVLERFRVDNDKIHVVYLGIDHEAWADVPEEAMMDVKRKYSLPSAFLLFVGAVEPRKNLLRLLEAVKTVHQRCGPVPLVIVGRAGQDSDRLARRIRELNLTEKVRFLGYRDERELRCFYRLASLFVFPSLGEGFGLPLLEAMVSGLPIVASKAAALPEVLQDAALFFDPQDSEDMAGKMIQVMKDEDLQSDLAAKGRQRAQHFSWQRTAEQTLAIYRSTVASR